MISPDVASPPGWKYDFWFLWTGQVSHDEMPLVEVNGNEFADLVIELEKKDVQVHMVFHSKFPQEYYDFFRGKGGAGVFWIFMRSTIPVFWGPYIFYIGFLCLRDFNKDKHRFKMQLLVTKIEMYACTLMALCAMLFGYIGGADYLPFELQALAQNGLAGSGVLTTAMMGMLYDSVRVAAVEMRSPESPLDSKRNRICLGALRSDAPPAPRVV